MITLIILIALTIFTRFNGIIIIFFLILYFFLKYILTPIIKRDKEHWNKVKVIFKLKKTYIIIFILVVIIIIDLLGEYPLTLVPYIYLKQISYNSYFIELLPFLVNWYVIPLFIIGLIFLILYKNYIFLSWLITYYGALILVPLTDPAPRYALAAIPPILLIFSYTVSEIREYIKAFTNWKIPKFIFIILVALIVIPYYKDGVALIEPKSISFTGFRESGEWLGNNAKEAIIYTADTASTTVFSGLEENNLGGNIYHISSFREFDKFKDFTKNVTKEFYLEGNMWESGQPNWIFPMTQEKFDNIVSLGFNLVYVVERPFPTQEGMKKIPVIFIFRRS